MQHRTNSLLKNVDVIAVLQKILSLTFKYDALLYMR